MNRLLFAVVAALCELSLLGGESVDLVASGAPKACIVLADDAPKYQKYAADEFVRWTKELTGAEIPVGPSAKAGLTPISFELVPADKDIEYDGFRLTAAEKRVLKAVGEVTPPDVHLDAPAVRPAATGPTSRS